MARKTVVLICRNSDRARQVRELLGSSRAIKVLGATAISDVRGVVAAGCADLTIYYRIEDESREGVDAALWARSKASHLAPLVVLSDHYDEAEATTFFRMGVTDYLGVSDHADRLAGLVAVLLGPGGDADDAENQPGGTLEPSRNLAGLLGG